MQLSQVEKQRTGLLQLLTALLEGLELRGAPVTSAGVAGLRQSLPSVKIGG